MTNRRPPAFALAAILLVAVWGVSAAASAAHVGAVPPFPDVRPNPALPLRPVESTPLPFPGLLGTTAVVQDQVHPLFPQDGSVFPNSSIVTLGWTLPDRRVIPESARVYPDFFEVVLNSDTNPPVTIKKVFTYHMHEKTLHGLFNIVVPGRYQWQVAAVMPGGQRIKSPTRIFQVLRK